MAFLVILNLGRGNCASGFPTVTAQLWKAHETTPMQATAHLPAAPALQATHQHWQRFYLTLHSGMNWRRSRSPQDTESDFDIDEDDITVVTREEFTSLCETLAHQLNQWLNSDSFRRIDQLLRTHLNPSDQIRVIITAEEDAVLRLPWQVWQFLDDYPQAELALSPANYARSLHRAVATRRKVRVLAVLGDRQGIDTATDRQFLEQLPQSDVKVLVEPNRATLHQQLWQGHWDILFFAGHSSSQGRGYLQLNATDQLTIDQLKYGLRTAIANGLKLAIFNSCDGLGLARDLADLNLPQMIVMREPVPDQVAQEFLKYFLNAFSQGRSLYGSVRQAREQLQAWEDQFPCATWLPVVCQNPAEIPPLWRDWCGKPVPSLPQITQPALKAIVLSSVLATALVAGVRWFGGLQPLELAAFDRLMQLRPSELPDPRLLIVNITETDIQAEGQALRQGSLSDRTLSRLLQTLERAQPRVIGLDLYRDFAASPELAEQLQSDRLVAICKRSDPPDDPTGILPPPEVDESRLGFSDFVVDEDGAVRRYLLFTSPNAASGCSTPYAFSLQLVFRYLHSMGISAQFTPTGDLQWGTATFQAIQARTGGYQPTDARGSQILLNYRASPTIADIAERVTVAQVLQGQVSAAAIRDRVVLIGVNTPSSGDRWITPYGRAFGSQIAGVTLHAQMTSQLLSAVLDQRPQLWVWHPLGELIWIGTWAGIGAVLTWGIRRPLYQLVAIACWSLVAIGLCFGLLLQGGWVPLVPILGSLWGSALLYRLHPYSSHHSHSTSSTVLDRPEKTL